MKNIFTLLLILLLGVSAQSQNTWTQKANFPGAKRYSAGYCVIGDKVYLGLGFDGVTVFSDWWQYDPATDTWTQKASFPAGTRYLAVCMSIDGKAYVGLGAQSVGGLKKDWWEYDPTSDTWTQKNDFPSSARYGTANFVIDNKGYICCGNLGSATGPFTTEVWQYDPSNDIWTSKTSMPGHSKYGCVGFEIDGKGYTAMGGIKRPDGGYVFYKDVYQYDATNDSWTKKADFPERRSYGVSFVLNGKGYVGLGQKQGVMNSKIYSFDPSLNVWHVATSFPGGGRFVAAGFAVNGNAYVGLGALTDLSAYYNDIWEFSPAQKMTQEVAPQQSDCGITFSLNNNHLLPHFSESSNGQFYEYTLFDVSGKVIQTKSVNDETPIELNASLPKGIYFAVMQSKNGNSECTQKIIIQ